MNDHDMAQRLPNGVKARIDGAGDDWAAAHRDVIKNLYMTDLDAFAGYLTFEKSSEYQVFVEFDVNGYEDEDTHVGFVAFFDRKSVPWERAYTERCFKLTRRVQLALCRAVGAGQPVAPRFFYVCGREPWTLGEWDINTGKALATWEVTQANFRDVWEQIGLVSHRQTISRWIGKR